MGRIRLHLHLLTIVRHKILARLTLPLTLFLLVAPRARFLPALPPLRIVRAGGLLPDEQQPLLVRGPVGGAGGALVLAVAVVREAVVVQARLAVRGEAADAARDDLRGACMEWVSALDFLSRG